MMCVFVGNVGSVAINIDKFPFTVERDGYCIYINGTCIYEDFDADENVIEGIYSNLMQLLVVAFKDDYPTDEVHIFQVGE